VARAAFALALLARAAPARAEDPSDTELLLAGAGMALPTYVLGVMWHEGTHAAVAASFGAEILELRLYPSVYQGHFYFGLTRWTGFMSRGETAFTLVAPKLTDVVLLGSYSLLVAFDGLPENDYGSLALTVLATGAWVDFSKDLFSWNPTNDLMKVHHLYGHSSEWQRLPWRLLQASVSLAGAYVLALGYEDVFGDETPVMMPVMTTIF
jgi:hypothetical protein